MSITLSDAEIIAVTGGYERATKQLNVLHNRGFTRAYIGKDGKVVLERAHYEAVTKGELHKPSGRANLSFLRAA